MNASAEVVMAEIPEGIIVLGHPCVRWYTDTDGSVVYCDELRGKGVSSSHLNVRRNTNGVWFVRVHAHGVELASGCDDTLSGAEYIARLGLGKIAATAQVLIDSKETDHDK